MKKQVGIVLLIMVLVLSFGLLPAASVLASKDVVVNVGPIAIAPNGTIFAANYDGITSTVQRSDDNGLSWNDTALSNASGPISQIVVSPNYINDGRIYVAVCDPPMVYRVTNLAVAFPPIEDSEGNSVSKLYSIDVYFDGDDNWVLVGTDLDVLAVRDAFAPNWYDQELDKAAFEVNVAPDSELVWAVTYNPIDGDFVITCTSDPGQWGWVIGDAEVDGVSATEWADLDFPDDYTSDIEPGVSPVVYAALSDGMNGGGVYRIKGIEAPEPSVVSDLRINRDMVSLDISGATILAGALSSSSVYRSTNKGISWLYRRQPTGEGQTHVYMTPGVFDPETGEAFASTWGRKGGVFYTHDGGLLWTRVPSPTPPPAPTPSLETHLLAVQSSRFDSIADIPDGAKIGTLPIDVEWMQTALATYEISFVPVAVAGPEWYIALQVGVLDAVLVTHHPSDYLQEFIASGELLLLPWSGEAVAATTKAYPETTMAANLPRKTYKRQTESILGYAPAN